MRLNVVKCKVMHVGFKNLRTKYFMTDTINGTRHEFAKTRDPSDLKSHAQVDDAVNKANIMLGTLRTFTFRGVGMWKKLYITATFGICSVRLESIFQRRYKEAGERSAACDESCSFYERQIIHGKA